MARLVRKIVMLGCLTAVLTACVPHSPATTADQKAPTTASTQQETTSGTLLPEHDLFTPGLAQQVVAELVAAAEWRPVVKVTISREQARLTYVETGNRPRSVLWLAGKITPSDDGADLVAATGFDPQRFNLSDIAALFRKAAEVTGERNRQELHITEYDHGEALMTVTTTPESSTVFFTADGELIPRLDYTSNADIAIALADVTVNRLLVVAVGVDGGQRIWVDVVATPGVVERRIRPANVPMYLARRRETPSGTQFTHDQIRPEVLGLLLRTGPGLVDQPPQSAVTLEVHQPADASAPQITLTVNGAELETDLAGVPLKHP